jgi:hypothetical protein
MIEWGPTLVTQIFALSAILGTIVLIMRSSCRLFRKPPRCASSSRFGRLVRSCGTGALAISVYFLSVMAIFALWKLTSWTYQLGIVVGMQYLLFRMWRFSTQFHDRFLSSWSAIRRRTDISVELIASCLNRMRHLWQYHFAASHARDETRP